MPVTGVIGFMWSAIGMCAVVLVATVIIFMKILNRPRQRPYMPPPVAAGSPIGRRDHNIASPPPATDSVQSSPHTPPRPFVEYVRRTIDETPYYRRNGRRRFDPQYTY